MGSEEFDKRLTRVEQQCGEIYSDVKEIKTALLGDSFGNHGFAKRLENVEEKTKALEGFKNRVIGYTSGAAGAVTALVNGVIQLVKNGG